MFPDRPDPLDPWEGETGESRIPGRQADLWAIKVCLAVCAVVGPVVIATSLLVRALRTLMLGDPDPSRRGHTRPHRHAARKGADSLAEGERGW